MSEFLTGIGFGFGIIFMILSSILGYLFSHFFEIVTGLFLLFISFILIRIYEILKMILSKIEEESDFKNRFMK